jgi:hypothetical protein
MNDFLARQGLRARLSIGGASGARPLRAPVQKGAARPYA